MIIRGTGYLHRGPSLQSRAASAVRSFRVGDSYEPRLHPTLPALWGPALDQGPTESCTAFWACRGIEITTQLATRAKIKLSPLALYYWTLKRSGEPMVDSGAYLDDMTWAMNKFGYCSDQWWPSRNANSFDLMDRVCKRPVEAAWVNARRMRREYPVKVQQIIATGDRLIQRILHSLELNQYCGVAIPVGNEYMRGDAIVPAQDVVFGWHMTSILDWRVNSSGQYELLNGGSWGDSWGMNGKVWLSADLVKQAQAAYFMV